jgi:hypothetical protein
VGIAHRSADRAQAQTLKIQGELRGAAGLTNLLLKVVKNINARCDRGPAESTGVAGNIGDVNRAASEMSDASSQVLTFARVVSGEGAKPG